MEVKQKLIMVLEQYFEDSTEFGASLWYRKSHRRCSIKKGIPKNLAKFTEKRLCWSLFLNNKGDSNTDAFL